MRVHSVAVVAVSGIFAAMTLQGCGGKKDGGDVPTPAPTPAPTTPTPPGPPPIPGPAPARDLSPLRPMRSIAYNPMPCSPDDLKVDGVCNQEGVPKPGQDFVQEGYKALWGPTGRDDLGMMSVLGGNAVRLYHSLGLETQHDHKAFLDRALEVGLRVLPGFHTQMACSDFDCFDSWKKAALAGFEKGYQVEGDWHPAVPIVILQNEPDTLNFGGAPPPVCDPASTAKCRVRAALSALDGLLQAEKEKGITGTTKITITWSFDSKDSIDGVVKDGIGIFGFQDMIAGVANPEIANYNPRSSQAELQEAFDKRWIHGVNSHSPWSFIKTEVFDKYQQFEPRPWFLGEFRGDGMGKEEIQLDLASIDEESNARPSFLGVTVFSFQNDYMVPVPQMYGLFALGNKTVTGGPTVTDPVFEEDVNSGAAVSATWGVYCIEANTPDGRASAVAAAWNGSTTGHGKCPTIEAPTHDHLVVV